MVVVVIVGAMAWGARVQLTKQSEIEKLLFFLPRLERAQAAVHNASLLGIIVIYFISLLYVVLGPRLGMDTGRRTSCVLSGCIKRFHEYIYYNFIINQITRRVIFLVFVIKIAIGGYLVIICISSWISYLWTEICCSSHFQRALKRPTKLWRKNERTTGSR